MIGIPSADDKIKGYQEAVTNEMEAKIPDVDFLEFISKKIMDYAASEDDLFDRIKLYVSVIRILDNAIINGAGHEKDDEFILVNLMDECRNSMLTDIESKYKELSAEEFGNVYDLLKSESLNVELLDGVNRSGQAFEKLVSLTKGRTRITNDGAYVRGAVLQ